MEKASKAALRKCETLAKMLAEVYRIPPQCPCGNVFADDAVFCRMCGVKRPGEELEESFAKIVSPLSTQSLRRRSSMKPLGVAVSSLGPGGIVGQLALIEDEPGVTSVVTT